MKIETNIIGGLAGAIALNAVHQIAQKYSDKAPRVDLVGEEALSKSLSAVGISPPTGKSLKNSTFAADIISNATYYSMIGKGGSKNIMLRGVGYGLAAGLGAVGLTKPLGLDDTPVTYTNATKVLTVAWYVIGGLAAAFAIRQMNKSGSAKFSFDL